jgi:hypothetical protein
MRGLPCRCRQLLVLACLVLTGAGGCDILNIRPRINEPRDVKETASGTPGKFSYRLAPYVFLADFDIPRNSPIFRDLSGLRDQVYHELKLPPSNAIVQVFLFEDRERYENFMQQKYPDLPKRRAFFVAQPRRLGGSEDLLVYTYWGERIQQDLRHELTHALLHSVLKDVPLWLDEGLAEFFEVPTGWDGVNSQHLEQLRAKTAERPNLKRLEQISEVEKMTPADYREAWAWAHLMLRSTPGAKKVLLDTIQELRTNPRPGPLQPRLADVFLSLDEAIDRHLADLASKNPSPAGNSR